MNDPIGVPRDLDPVELRVLGCLVEKESTVPDTYPLTLNSLRSACNQSTSREPVMSLGEAEIDAALTRLRARHLTRTVHSTSNRATKYRHVLPDALVLDAGELAVLSVLFLRGAQTIGELKARTERQHPFASLDEVAAVLAALAGREQPLVRQLARQPGQKDARWIHLLGADAGQSEPVIGLAEAPPPADPYGTCRAEFHDVLAAPAWELLALELLDAFDGIDPAAGPIVDVGSGTGVGLAAIADAADAAGPGSGAVSGAVSVWAIEPSPAMRVGLAARLSADRRLAAITTVVPLGVGSAPFPERAAAIVVAGVLGSIGRTERQRLWRYAASQLATGGVVVVGMIGHDVQTDTRQAEQRFGGAVRTCVERLRQLDDGSIERSFTAQVRDAVSGAVLVDETVVDVVAADTVATLADEVRPFGLRVEHRPGSGVALVRPVEA